MKKIFITLSTTVLIFLICGTTHSFALDETNQSLVKFLHDRNSAFDINESLTEDETSALLQNDIQGEMIEESLDGWGIFLPSDGKTPYSLRCPLEFHSENGIDTYVTIDQEVKDIYVIGFTDELNYFIEDNKLLDEYRMEAAIDGYIMMLTSMSAGNGEIFGYMGELLINTIDLGSLTSRMQNLMEDISEEEQNMAFYYLELSKLADDSLENYWEQ